MQTRQEQYEKGKIKGPFYSWIQTQKLLNKTLEKSTPPMYKKRKIHLGIGVVSQEWKDVLKLETI